MANNLGDFDASAVIYGKFTTTAAATGAPTTLAGTPALSVYKDNSVTQSTTGVTLTVDFDGVTGLQHFAVDTSADGTFYSAGSFFDVVITTGTVGGTSAVGYTVGQFTIRKTSALKPTTAGRTLVVDASGLADANTVKLGPSGSGTAQTAGDVGIKTGFALSATGLDAVGATATGVAAIADGVLNRDMSVGTDSGSPTVRTMRQALRFLRNKWSISGTTLTVTKEDDTTASWTSTVTATAGADPITANDPA